nr:MAG TPA: hypothetical protein [Caudoviricetes sp.]
MSHPPVDVPRRSSDERVPVVAHGHLLGAILARYCPRYLSGSGGAFRRL